MAVIVRENKFGRMGVLHTNAERFNTPAVYTNLNKLGTTSNKQIISLLRSQIQQMQYIETNFYKSLGYNGEDFSGFMKWLRGLLPQKDRAFLTELSATLKNKNLYDYYKKEISLSESNYSRADYNKATNINDLEANFNQLLKENNIITIEVKAEDTASKTSREVFNKFTKKGGQATVDLNAIIQEVIDSKEFKDKLHSIGAFDAVYKKIMDEARKRRLAALEESGLLKTKTKNGKEQAIAEKNYKKIDPFIVYKKLEPVFARALMEKNYSEQVAFDLIEIGVWSEKGRNIITDNKKQLGTEEDQLFQFFMNKASGCTTEMKSAFRTVWMNNLPQIKNSLKAGGTDFIGGLGEMTGMILLYYIQEKTGNHNLAKKYEEAWTAQKTFNGEQMRADIMLEKITGIQVKNYQQQTLGDAVQVKLHPYQILSRLVQNGELTEGSRTYQEFETAFANMSFNRTSFDALYTTVEVALKPFIASIANFSLQLNNIIDDTANIWLVGGAFLIPGSEILKLIIQIIKDQSFQKEALITLTSSVQKTDKSFKKNNDYWENVDGFWEPTEENLSEFQTLINSNKLSTHVYFNLSSLIYTKKGNFRSKYRVF